MKSLTEWKKEWNDQLSSHQCSPTPCMLAEWEDEEQHLLKLNYLSDTSLIIFNLIRLRIDMHISKHDKWLAYPPISISDPTNLELLSSITHPDDRIFSLETELMGYEIMMSLQPKERKRFWLKYNRRLKSKNGEYILYLISIDVFMLDEENNPCLLKIQIERLPCNYQPEQFHYREFSHKLKKAKVEKCVLAKLSGREKQVLELASEGFTSKEIAKELGISKHTVKNFRKRYLKKLGAKNTHIATIVAKKQKII